MQMMDGADTDIRSLSPNLPHLVTKLGIDCSSADGTASSAGCSVLGDVAYSCYRFVIHEPRLRNAGAIPVFLHFLSCTVEEQTLHLGLMKHVCKSGSRVKDYRLQTHIYQLGIRK